MSWRVCRQPDGAFAIWSTVVDDWIVTDATPVEIESLFVDSATMQARDAAEKAIRRADVATWRSCNVLRARVKGLRRP